MTNRKYAWNFIDRIVYKATVLKNEQEADKSNFYFLFILFLFL